MNKALPFFNGFGIRASLMSLGRRHARHSGENTKFNLCIYDEFINNHWVDDTAGGVLIPRGYHQTSSQNLCADMTYY